MRHSIVFAFVFLFLITTCYAQTDEIRFWHERGTNLTIYEKCRAEGAKCDDTYECTFTALSPSQVLIVNNETMNGPNVYHNFTLFENQTQVNGIYESTVDCTNGTNSGSNTFYFQVTPNGSPPIDEGQGLLILGGIILLIIISASLGWMGFKMNNGAVGLSLISLSVLIFIFSLGMILNIFQLSFGTFGGIVDNYSVIYVLFVILAGMGMLGLIIWLIVLSLRLYWKNRGLIEDGVR